MTNPVKQYRKLVGLGQRAQSCLSREEAQKLIRKAEKAQRKLRNWINGQNSKGELAEDQGSP